MVDLQTAWRYVLDNAAVSQRAWLRNGRPLTLHADTVMVAVPNDFTREQLESRLRKHVEELLSVHFSRPTRLAVTVDADTEVDDYEPETRTWDHQPVDGPGVLDEALPTGFGSDLTRSALGGERSGGGQGPSEFPTTGRSNRPDSPRRDIDSRLNPKYSFETFVIGSSNRFAHAAAVAVAEAPGAAYNPLMIYGDSGLGKTHLLHALGHYVRNYYDRVRVRYVSTEELTNDFINSVAENKTAQFRRRYRDVDVLLIDDIQFLENKIQTQEEFFHTFNTLHNAQKQIVMTSDRPPKALEALEPRLRSRFEMGLLTDVQPPDLETRIAILRKKAAQERLTAAPDVLEFIASRIQTNIRELEGALIRVTAFASLNRQPVDMALAEIVLRDLIPEGGEAQITAGQIMAQTAAYFGVSIDDLSGQSRTHMLATARQIAMYLCRELTDMSLPKIGLQFGGRDHTTVMHADRKIRQLLSERRQVFNQVTELTNRIKQQGSRR
ncbi:MAG: chromosomal replication initiator protein DnaA [Propionibacteriaceae bacterium]